MSAGKFYYLNNFDIEAKLIETEEGYRYMENNILNDIDSMIEQLKLLKMATTYIHQDKDLDQNIKTFIIVRANLHRLLDSIFVDIVKICDKVGDK
jgi:hypothetical protein